jgi:lysophospholipid acyltransferase (LPLAT)-like uncharacterized protein
MAVANQKSGVVIPHEAKWYQRLAAAVICFLIRLGAMTIRFHFEDRSGLLQGASRQRVILAIWHNRLAFSGILYERYIQKYEQERRMAGLVSASRDGGLLAEIMENFGAVPIRGSSSRRGAQALVEMTTCAERDYDLAFTPDGPRGPCYEVQGGAITAAQLTGLPIVPVGYHLSWKIRLKSWDRFQIPLPFARCNVIIGKSLIVPREITDEERQTFRKQLEQALREISRD